MERFNPVLFLDLNGKHFFLMVSIVAVDSEKASFLLTIVEKPENTRFFS